MTVPENPPGAAAVLCEAAGAGLTVFVGAADDEVAFGVGATLGALVAAGKDPKKLPSAFQVSPAVLMVHF